MLCGAFYSLLDQLLIKNVWLLDFLDRIAQFLPTNDVFYSRPFPRICNLWIGLVSVSIKFRTSLDNYALVLHRHIDEILYHNTYEM